MLNILLGIGIGGVLMMVKKANHKHKKHPNKAPKYGPYPIQVGGTLMISAITLLVILVGLLIIVPMNKWIFLNFHRSKLPTRRAISRTCVLLNVKLHSTYKCDVKNHK